MLLVLLHLICNLYSGTFIPVMYIQKGGTQGAAKCVTDVLIPDFNIFCDLSLYRPSRQHGLYLF